MNSLVMFTFLLSLPAQDAAQEPASPTGMHQGIQTIKLSAASQRVLSCAGLSPEERAIANEMKVKIQELRSLREQIIAERLALNSAIDELTLLSDSLSARAQQQKPHPQSKPQAASPGATHLGQNNLAADQNPQAPSQSAARPQAKGNAQASADTLPAEMLDPAALVTVIERMKAPKAAAVLANMDQGLAKKIIRRMKPGKAAKLLSAIDDKQAAIYARALVQKAKTPADDEEQP